VGRGWTKKVSREVLIMPVWWKRVEKKIYCYV